MPWIQNQRGAKMNREPGARGLVSAAALGLAIALVVSAGPANAQSSAQDRTIATIVDRLDRLEQDIGQWQKSISEGGSGTVIVTDSEAMTAINRRIADLNQDLRDLIANSRGRQTNLGEFADRLGQFGDRIAEFGSRLDNLVEAVDVRLTALEEAELARALQEQALALAREKAGRDEPRPSKAPDQDATAGLAADGGLPDGTPMERYDFARARLVQGDYEGAERAFRAFLEAHPSDGLAGNAQYWLGETYYVRNDFDAATREFLNGYQRYPESAKAPDFLLKLGMTLSALGQRAEACVTFEELAAKFPLVSDDISRRSAAERAVLGCP